MRQQFWYICRTERVQHTSRSQPFVPRLHWMLWVTEWKVSVVKTGFYFFPPLLLTRDGLLCPPRHFADKTSSSLRLTESRTSFSGLHNGPGTRHFQLLIPASTFSQIYMIKFVVSRERDTLAKLLFMIYSRYVMFFLWFQIKFSVT